MTNRLRAAWPAGIAMLVALILSGCSTTAENSGLSLVDASGNHPAGFVSVHPSLILSAGDAAQCRPCHGDSLTGGIANVSCFNAACHHDPVQNWPSPGEHGAAAKRAPGDSSFIVCAVCHGADFGGGGSGASCLNSAACHGAGIASPHPRRPWRRAGTDNTHTNTDPVNASACGQCHLNGANSTKVPAPPLPPPGTPPECFNNTLCHGAEAAPHPLGAAWLNPTTVDFHGTNATINAKQNLAFCQTCHGTAGTTSFDGGIAPTACSTAACHPVAKAHPTTWYSGAGAFPSYVPSHRNAGNIPGACVICHNTSGPGAGPMPGAPSCFSADFNNGVHGLVTCHVNGPGEPNHDLPFTTATHFQASQTTFTNDCGNCHAVSGTSPVATAPPCSVCHVAGSPLTSANCSSCHGSATPPDASRKGMPVGTQYPNAAGRHGEHVALNPAGSPISCDTCHNGIGSQTASHYNRANGRVRTLAGPGVANFGAGFLYTSQNGGAASFDNTPANLTCANVRCHGGTPLAPAPNWQTATIDTLSNAGCRLCHKGANQAPAQYNDLTNSPYTQHTNHAFSRNFSCTTCHDTAALTQSLHFGDLANTTFPAGAANSTIVGTLNWDPTPPINKDSCTTPAQGCH